MQVCSSSVLSVWIPNPYLLQYVKVVNDYLAPCYLKPTGRSAEKGWKKNYCWYVLVVLGISRDKITTSGAASPLLSAGGSVLPGFYLSFISAGSPSTHCYHSCSCSPTSRQTRGVFPRPVLLTANQVQQICPPSLL